MASQNKTNLSSLGSQLAKEVKLIKLKSNELIKEIAFKILDDVTESTVVDTSKAVSNWVTTLDAPANSEIEANSKGKYGSTAEDSIGVVIAKSILPIKDRKFGQSLFITNNIEGDVYQKRARVLEAEAEAYDDALLAIAKAELLVGNAL